MSEELIFSNKIASVIRNKEDIYLEPLLESAIVIIEVDGNIVVKETESKLNGVVSVKFPRGKFGSGQIPVARALSQLEDDLGIVFDGIKVEKIGFLYQDNKFIKGNVGVYVVSSKNIFEHGSYQNTTSPKYRLLAANNVVDEILSKGNICSLTLSAAVMYLKTISKNKNKKLPWDDLPMNV